MTEQRHIITDEELDEIVSLSGQYGSYFDVCRLIERVRSRPAPQAGETLYTASMVANRVAKAQKDEREKVLDKIIPRLGISIQTDISDNDYVWIEDLESTIESLRREGAP